MTGLMTPFEEHRVGAQGEQLFARTAGSGPPVLLLHGYPQSSIMWHAVAPTLAERYSVFAFDLPGYGQSDAPPGGPERYAKRMMAGALVRAMATLGHETFAVIGHDRGGRVAYRMALDHPQSVTALGVLDIVPTAEVWDKFTVQRAMGYYHWTFLAQPEPLPERLIAGDPKDYLHRTLASWTKARDLSVFHPEALAAYEAAFAQPERISAMCMDYRAGATLDWEDDVASLNAGQRITAPTLALWGGAFGASGARQMLTVWQGWADDVAGEGVDAGHFVAEENPSETLRALTTFLAQHAR